MCPAHRNRIYHGMLYSHGERRACSTGMRPISTISAATEWSQAKWRKPLVIPVGARRVPTTPRGAALGDARGDGVGADSLRGVCKEFAWSPGRDRQASHRPGEPPVPTGRTLTMSERELTVIAD